jgi:hypothetical protein
VILRLLTLARASVELGTVRDESSVKTTISPLRPRRTWAADREQASSNGPLFDLPRLARSPSLSSADSVSEARGA